MVLYRKTLKFPGPLMENNAHAGTIVYNFWEISGYGKKRLFYMVLGVRVKKDILM